RPIPRRGLHDLNVAVHERDVAASIVPQVRPAPIRVPGRSHATGAGRVVGRIVHDPTTGLFGRLRGDAFERIFGVGRPGAAIGEVNGRRRVSDRSLFDRRPVLDIPDVGP